MLISYNWIKSYIKEIPEPEKLSELLTFHLCEVENVEKVDNGDTVLDLNVLPDRAHDLLSHRGVAREIAGLLGVSFDENNYENKIKEVTETDLKIEVTSPLCRRYVGRIVRNVKVGPSPVWLRDLLASIGQRSINNIVDISNFIMFDLGQPVHTFDLDKLESHKLIIRKANEGEEIELLGFEKTDGADKERRAMLSQKELVIADEKEAVVIAGVKGGKKAEVDNNTRNIVIEVANFDPVTIRKTAGKFGIKTDASKRYENEITPELCKDTMDKISAYIKETCEEATFEEVVDVYNQKPEEVRVSFDKEYISKIIGVDIDDLAIKNILEGYRYTYEFDNGIFNVLVPSYRLDLRIPADFAEEIGRIYGYDKVEPVLPKMHFDVKDNDVWTKVCLAKNKLVNDGYREVMTSVFRDKGKVKVMAAASDKSCLRDNIKDGLKESIDLNIKNIPLLMIDEVKVFEIGTVFLGEEEKINVAYGDKKNITEISLDDYVKGLQGLSTVNELAVIPKTEEEFEYFKPWSSYPFIVRDIAVWLPEGIPPEKLIDIYKSFGTELLVREPRLFDSFTKDGRTSFAYRLVFQSDEKTLTDEEINVIMDNITKKIVDLGYEVR
ncbi:MAG: phenylalanine--tRNA ligase subunit beta [Candidatus Moranbacteria bacterium]|nr:phenylalanine--tRNA ligase subunit beta [Candidatus Moranbacteria bacterium]